MPGASAEVYRHASVVTPETTLFALGALVCGANSVADSHQSAYLHQMLLDCPADASVDALYPVRQTVVTQLAHWPVASRREALQFLLGHAMAVTNFTALVPQLVGPPPTFAVISGGGIAGLSDRWTDADRLALSGLLRTMWQEAHLQTVWQTLVPAWHAAQIPSQQVRQVAQQLEMYLHLSDRAALTLAYVTVDPLMPAGSGVTSIFADDHYAIILGPSTTLAEAHTLLAHELAHPIVNAFFRADQPAHRALQNARCVYDAVTHDPMGKTGISGVYTDWEVYFAETLVRTISHHIMHTTEAPDGFILQPTMAWELQRYDTNHWGFEELTVRCLNRLQHRFCSHDRPPKPSYPLGA